MWPPGSALSGPVAGKGQHQGKGEFSKEIGLCFHLRSPQRSSLRTWSRPDIPKFSGKKTRKSDLKSASLQPSQFCRIGPLPQDFPEKLSCARGATLRLWSLLPLKCISVLFPVPGYGSDPSSKHGSCTVNGLRGTHLFVL